MNWGVAKNAVEMLGIRVINLPRLMIYEEIKLPLNGIRYFDFLSTSDFIVYSPTRHLWKTNSDPIDNFKIYGGVKRNDKLIRAFAEVIKNKLFINPKLVFFEYGTDVKHSKLLVSELGISDFVIWLPEMPRKQVMAGMLRANFVADQFREGMSATSAGVTNEAISCGIPVISNTDGAIFDRSDPYYGCPILQALTIEEIYYYFHDYSENKQKYIELGQLSKIWFKKNLSTNLAKKYIEILKNMD
jgi:glycosyltransferase involved in cell wall biosynthesis